jgi:hypothetical protein
MLFFSIRPFQRKDNGGEIALSRKQLPTVLLETVSQILFSLTMCSSSRTTKIVGARLLNPTPYSQGNSSFLFL